VNISKSEIHRIRFHFSLFLSIFFHASILLWILLPNYQVIFCGVEYPELEEKEYVFQIDLDPSLNFEMGSDTLEHLSKLKEKLDSDSQFSSTEGEEKSKAQKDQGKVAGFDKEKYKGTGWEELIENLESVKDLRKNYMETYDNLLPNSDVAESYIRRFRHYEDMVVKEVFPTVYSIDKSFEQEISEAETILEKHNTRNQIIEEFRNQQEPEELTKVELEKDLKKANNKTLVPLVMPEPERDQYLDKILPDTKESQIQEFVEKFSGYDPNKGDLPLMYRDLYYKNLQRLAYTFSSDPTYFTADYFEENLNKEDYLRNAMNLISKLKGTKTATEILFTILDIYEIQERAIYQHFQNKLMWPNYTSEQKKQIRVETIRRVIEKYDPVFKSKKIESYEDVTKLYEKKKLQIVDFLIKTTPNYRLADAHFEKGRLYFERYMKTPSQIELLEKARQEWKIVSQYKSKKNEEAGDFLNEKIFLQIEPYLSSLDSLKGSKDLIYSQILSRMNERLQKKKEREEALLWKKSTSSTLKK